VVINLFVVTNCKEVAMRLNSNRKSKKHIPDNNRYIKRIEYWCLFETCKIAKEKQKPTFCYKLYFKNSSFYNWWGRSPGSLLKFQLFLDFVALFIKIVKNPFLLLKSLKLLRRSLTHHPQTLFLYNFVFWNEAVCW